MTRQTINLCVKERSKEMNEGVLVYGEQQDRIDIRFGLKEYYGGLHCGECFEVMIGDEWKPTRIENNSNGWYLVGIDKSIPLVELKVRMS